MRRQVFTLFALCSMIVAPAFFGAAPSAAPSATPCDYGWNCSIWGQWSDVYWLNPQNVSLGDNPQTNCDLLAPAHMSVLPDGRVIAWGYANDDPNEHNVPGQSNPLTCENATSTTRWYSWDPITNPTAAGAAYGDVDGHMFCSGHAFMPDGRLLVCGGGWHFFASHTKIFDWQTNSWYSGPSMEEPRYYPTVTALGSGEMLVAGGEKTHGSTESNKVPEVLTSGSWRRLLNPAARRVAIAYSDWDRWYPWMFAAPNGQVFYAGGSQSADGYGNGASGYLSTTGDGYWTNMPTHPTTETYGSAVMFGTGRVMVLGGGTTGSEPGGGASGSCGQNVSGTRNWVEEIDLNATSPTWDYVDSLARGRVWANSTVLADGRVFVSGGWDGGDPLHAEIFNMNNVPTGTPDPPPGKIAGQISGTRAPHRPRGYHSVAVLLPDARVMVAGTDEPRDSSCREPNAEFYSPSYLYNSDSTAATRPVISSAPSTVSYNSTMYVYTSSASTITKVTWVRLPSVTHGVDQNQRLNELSFTTDAANGRIVVTTPASGNIAPPGHYMLFILKSGVPSVAKIVKIS